MRFFSKRVFDLFLETRFNVQGILYVRFTNRKFGHRVYLRKIVNFTGIVLSFLLTGTYVASENHERSKLFIVDASGSMNEYLGIYQKIHLAKNTLVALFLLFLQKRK